MWIELGSVLHKEGYSWIYMFLQQECYEVDVLSFVFFWIICTNHSFDISVLSPGQHVSHYIIVGLHL